MDFWTSIGGMVEVELTSADPAGCLRAINAAGITVYHARQEGDLTLKFSLHRSDYQKLRLLTKRRGERLSFDRRSGLYWIFRKLPERPVLLAGIVLLIALSLFLPTRVLFIQVEGNAAIPTRLILEGAEDCGITFGASRREVRSEKMKNALLQAIPELQWAGINTSGCTAVISVRERTEPEEQPQKSGVSSIVAARDGVIHEMTVTKGNPVCKVGQAVKEGQVLVSGYTDLGICIRATQAEAEIFADTQRSLTAVFPSNYEQRTEITRQEKKYGLLIGKNRINFYKGSGISDTSCDKMYSEYFMTLPGGFRLPVALVVEEWTYYDQTSITIDESTAGRVLSDFSSGYLTQHMVAGCIDSRSELLEESEGAYRQHGIYACFEMIGKTRLEENLENYEAN